MLRIIPVENIESTSNKVTEITELATNEQYPSAKAVYDALQDVEIDEEYLVGRKTAGGGEIFNDYENNQSGYGAHAEGRNTTASGVASHAEGFETDASTFYAHAEGCRTKATGISSHAEGDTNTASGDYSHVEGYDNVSSGQSSHSEGNKTKATGTMSHSEGYFTTASGPHSHAEGSNTIASGNESHAGGLGTVADTQSQTTIGQYNKKNSNALLIVGNGSGPEDINRSNAFEVGKNGTATLPSLTDSNGNPDPTAIGTSEYSVATKGYVDTLVSNINIIKNGVIVFDMYHPFDLNHDGVVNQDDVMLISQYVAGHDMSLYPWLGTPYYSTEYLWGDINGDGNEDIDDTDLLAQYVAGWDVTSPVLEYYNKKLDDLKSSIIQLSERQSTIYCQINRNEDVKEILKECTSSNNVHKCCINVFETDTKEAYIVMGGQVFKLNKEEE